MIFQLRLSKQKSVMTVRSLLVPIYTDNLESVGAVVAEESLESDTPTHTHKETLTCDIDPVPISIYFKF